MNPWVAFIGGLLLAGGQVILGGAINFFNIDADALEEIERRAP